jgi:hypothetical protein
MTSVGRTACTADEICNISLGIFQTIFYGKFSSWAVHLVSFGGNLTNVKSKSTAILVTGREGP